MGTTGQLMEAKPLRILTINLCTYLPGHPRRERLLKVRQFVEDNGVGVVLFQEGLNVCWPAYSSARQLRSWEHLYSRAYIGVPWCYEWHVGIMSAYPIIKTDSLYCEVPQTEWLDFVPLPGRRRAVAVWVDVPGMGIVALVSVHLTSSPKTELWRQEQVAILLDWVKGFEADRVIIGGDFNFGYDNRCYWLIRDKFNQMGESTPDFIFANKGRGEGRIVLNDGTVTDHQGGLLVEMT